MRVESAAKELGYVPNLAARALASQRTEVIGVLIPSLTNNVFSDVLRGIYDALGRQPLQHPARQYALQHPAGRKLLRLFLAQKPAGLIVTGINQTAESRAIMESVDCPIVQIMEIGPDADRHDDRLFALMMPHMPLFRIFSRKDAGGSASSARAWIRGCSGGSTATGRP